MDHCTEQVEQVPAAQQRGGAVCLCLLAGNCSLQHLQRFSLRIMHLFSYLSIYSFFNSEFTFYRLIISFYLRWCVQCGPFCEFCDSPYYFHFSFIFKKWNKQIRNIIHWCTDNEEKICLGTKRSETCDMFDSWICLRDPRKVFLFIFIFAVERTQYTMAFLLLWFWPNICGAAHMVQN